jgi:hypothetical protein
MQAVTATEAKPSKRRSTKKTLQTSTTPKQKLTLYVSVEASKRLGVHATMFGTDRSALVQKLIEDNLKRFVVADRAKPADDVIRQGLTAGSTPDEESGN